MYFHFGGSSGKGFLVRALEDSEPVSRKELILCPLLGFRLLGRRADRIPLLQFCDYEESVVLSAVSQTIVFMCVCISPDL